ncbi:MAG: hypothetical protein ACREQ5_30550 [Candidatus Dormibacteria bacterium]
MTRARIVITNLFAAVYDRARALDAELWRERESPAALTIQGVIVVVAFVILVALPISLALYLGG